ncbi:GNAT family N-acetyltransferase [Marinobacteraceae bacterium S3BR75-40.1]
MPAGTPGDNAFCQWLGAIQQRARHLRQRALVVVEGDADWGREQALKAAGLLGDAALWLGEQPPQLPSNLAPVAPAQARQWLGRQIDGLVWDGWQTQRPDALGALSGTLGAGGLWLWLVPPLAQWREGAAGAFLARMARLLAADTRLWHWRQGEPVSALPAVPEGPAVEAVSGPTSDQATAINAIETVLRGHRRRPLVITADRGRGKTAALGMAAGVLASQGPVRILVTAPRRQALESLWRHAPQTWEGVVVEENALQDGRSQLSFQAPDRILRERPEADLLLVDEAAALPAPVLETLLARYSRIVFSSTIHGYEGTGRGFAVRFRETLEERTPQWRGLHLNEPVRWAAGDPLEAVMNDLLLMDAEPSAVSAPPDEWHVRRWLLGERGQDEARLRAAFGLLVNAHYQTSPDDLRQLLDDPAGEVWLAETPAGKVLGALWLVREGPLEAELAEAVWRGERRLPGALLPQALAYQGGDPAAAQLAYGRIVRVAAVAECRRQGIGAALVRRVVEEAADQGLTVLGTSFGASPELVTFWEKAGFQALRLGLKRDAASGTFAIVMARGAEARGRRLCHQQAGRFAEHWPWLRAHDLQKLDPELVWQLEKQWAHDAGLELADRRELQAFAEGHRGLSVSTVPLQRLSARMARRGLVNDWQPEQRTLWVRAVLQGWSWDELRTEGLVVGRKPGERLLRALTADVLQQIVS